MGSEWQKSGKIIINRFACDKWNEFVPLCVVVANRHDMTEGKERMAKYVCKKATHYERISQASSPFCSECGPHEMPKVSFEHSYKFIQATTHQATAVRSAMSAIYTWCVCVCACELEARYVVILYFSIFSFLTFSLRFAGKVFSRFRFQMNQSIT